MAVNLLTFGESSCHLLEVFWNCSGRSQDPPTPSPKAEDCLVGCQPVIVVIVVIVETASGNY